MYKLWPFSSEERKQACAEELAVLEAKEEMLIKQGRWMEFVCDHAGIQNAERCPYCGGTGKVKKFIRRYLSFNEQERFTDLRRLFEIYGGRDVSWRRNKLGGSRNIDSFSKREKEYDADRTRKKVRDW